VHAVIRRQNRLLTPELGGTADSLAERVAAEVFAPGPALRQANAMD
jgi:hypothetical protein